MRACNAYLLALAASQGEEGSGEALVAALEGMAAGSLFGAKPDGVSYEIVVDALLRAGKAAEAAAVYGKGAAGGMQPTAKGVALGMTALLRSGQPEGALGVLAGAVGGGGAGVEPVDGAVRAAVKSVLALGGGPEGLAAVKGKLVV